MRRARGWRPAILVLGLLAGCGGAGATVTTAPVASSPTIPVDSSTSMPPRATTVPSTTSTSTTIEPTTAATFTTVAPTPATEATSAATTPPTTAPRGATAGYPMQEIETRTIGTSVQGRPIVAVRYGAPGGVPVMAVGVIHGDEQGGLKVLDQLRSRELPAGLDLWVIDTINPDGVAARTRGNANGVDLNRNFATDDWQPVGAGTTRWAGTGPGSEPETQAVQAFVTEIKPRFSVWWHQVGNHVDQNEDVADYALLESFARDTGMPIIVTSCGSTPCVGNATTFVNALPAATSFVVEMPSRVTDSIAAHQAKAFVDVAASIVG